ncbi:MAG: M23 family metallopeptidase [Acidobacteria bacterium]|nr:M23 family metallopeptidase [Acidobacteriota bacterium]
MWAGRILGCLLLAWMSGTAWAAEPPASEDPDWKISHRERSLQPGEVVLMTVVSPQPLERMEATVFGRTFAFFPDASGTTWIGLVGIDLDVPPAKHEVQLQGSWPDIGEIQGRYLLSVKDKRFPTRRLTVDENYVTPPAEQLERIQRESERVSAIFGTNSEERYWKGSFLRPVPGAATSNFGKRSIFNGQPRSPHGGMDFRAAQGTPVHAPNAGKVVLAENLYFAGNVVILDHGLGLYSYFAHLSRITVSEGDLVSRGAVIGQVGATGRVTGPHLHWSLRLSGTRVDPLSLVAILSEINLPES